MSNFNSDNLLSREEILGILIHRAEEAPMGEESRNRKADSAQELKNPEELYDSFLSDSQFYLINGELCRVLPSKPRRILTEKGGTLHDVKFEVSKQCNNAGFFSLDLVHEKRLITNYLRQLNRTYRFFYARKAATEPSPTGQSCYFTGATSYWPTQPSGVYVSSKALCETSKKQQKDSMDAIEMESVGEIYCIMVADDIVKFSNPIETEYMKKAAILILDILHSRSKFAMEIAVEEKAAALDQEVVAKITDEGVKKASVVAGFAPSITEMVQ